MLPAVSCPGTDWSCCGSQFVGSCCCVLCTFGSPATVHISFCCCTLSCSRPRDFQHDVGFCRPICSLRGDVCHTEGLSTFWIPSTARLLCSPAELKQYIKEHFVRKYLYTAAHVGSFVLLVILLSLASLCLGCCSAPDMYFSQLDRNATGGDEVAAIGRSGSRRHQHHRHPCSSCCGHVHRVSAVAFFVPAIIVCWLCTLSRC